MDMRSFKMSSSKTPNDYAEAPRTEALRCNQIHSDSILKQIFVEGLPDFMRYSMRYYWSVHKSSTLHDLS